MTTNLPRTRLGDHGPEVSAFGLGCMGFSGMYGPTSDDEGVATIHAALDRGVTLLDTGDFYGMGHNERLVGRALRGRRRDDAVVSVKFGALRGPDGAWLGFDGRPAAVKAFLAYSLERLGLDHVDVYRPARLDPTVPIEETVGAVADLVKAGWVRHLGLSEVGAATVRRAHAVHPVVDVQIEYSLVSRRPEDDLFPTLRELGVGATLYGVLSRGLLAGRRAGGPGDFRAHLPRFADANRATNDAAVAHVAAFAAERGLSPAQALVAYVRAKWPAFVPLVGARSRAQLDDVLGGLARTLPPADVAALEALVPRDAVTGDR